jgi:hypothetical protein
MARWLAGTVVALLAIAAVLVAWRRLAGALVAPLEPLQLLSAAALMAVTAGGARLARRGYSVGLKPSRSVGPLALLPSLAVLSLGAALSLPGTEGRGLAAFWSLLAAEECWAWWPIARRSLRRASATAIALRPLRSHPPEAPARQITSPPSDDEPPAARVLQQLTRSRASDGAEELSGWLRMEFSAGQRSGSVHVAFCPPFAKTPELAVAQLDGPEARVKTAQLLPYGARIDLKLAAAAEQPGSVLLHFSARSYEDRPG